jgi:hypothetical protein
MNKYRYFVDNIQVYPVNDSDINYKFSRVSPSSVIWETILESDLLFKQQSGSFNFKTQEQNNKCQELEFKVERNCNGTWSTWFEGLFSVAEGTFNDALCTFKIRPRKKVFMLGDVEYNILQTPNNVTGATITGIETVDYGYRNYTQAKYFDKALLYLAQKSNPNIVGIISNFFQINPTGPFNVPGATNNYRYLVFAALADIQEPIPSNLTKKCMVKFFDVMDDLQVLFDVFWDIDSSGYLRIEHRYTLESSSNTLNLSTSPFLNKKLEYTHDLQDFVKEEIWTVAGHSEAAKITYGGLANLSKASNSKQYSTKVIHTDYYARFNSGTSEKGLFLFATNGGIGTFGNWRMLSDTFGYQYLNPGFLVRQLHKWGRPDLYGLFHAYQNTNIYTAESGGIVLSGKKPMLVQKDLVAPLCCGDELTSNTKVITPFGEGIIEEASFGTKDNMMKFTAKYPANNCHTFEPTDIPGLQLWLKYNEGQTLSGSNVIQWNDASGNNRHASQANPAIRPTKTVFNSVRFFGSQALATPAFQLMPGKRGTVIALFRIVGAVSSTATFGFSILSTDNGLPGQDFDLSSNVNYHFISANQGVIYPQNLFYSPNLYGQTGLFILDRFEDTFVQIRNNSLDCLTNPAINSNTTPASKPLIIGDNPNNILNNSADFELFELMIYDSSLSDVQKDNIEYYLVRKGIYNVHKY